ncbi:MAG: 1-deoxy-D-xylulose-5-phosphate synthase [Firmicutes bacterium]|nr:1-deoxy-D-xylulose-5-phosphate synthase [Bacillota bacterium]MBQ3964548.1 1-deoxy-D-xylulose-5-phosphate synthase [Bacillota bacterium]
MKQLVEYNFPEDLKKMSVAEMELLAVSIREFLIDAVAQNGGHLSSNLGVVELTIALHRYFNAPEDKIIFDVGHQCYTHKILTGRAAQFDTLRKLDGLSGFPKQNESEYDLFDTGHSSTSLSLLAGLSLARDRKGEDYKTVAVIGDGSMSGGLAYEALNNLGASKTKAIVILNDNEMSIGKSTGGFENHLSKLRVSKGYYSFKKRMSRSLEKIPAVGHGMMQGVTKVRDSLKYALVDGILFEELGFTYLGPVDGHNIDALLKHLELADACDGPVVLHVITRKGKGYRNAENNPDVFHGTGPFDKLTGQPLSKSQDLTYSQHFANKLIELAEKDKSVTAVSAAMIDGTGLRPFASKYPDRIYDVGIAEAYAVSFAAGLAKAGLKPVVAVYSTFLQRAYDQMLIDVCLNNLPVVLAIDRAGNVGGDGETHHGQFDLSYLGHMPNMTILAPRDGEELEAMLEYALSLGTPCAIRYPRGSASALPFPHISLEKGAQVFAEGADCEVWASGSMVSNGAQLVEQLRRKGIKAGLIDPRFVKPLDEEALLASANRTRMIFTMEDNVQAGGFGEKVAARLCNHPVLVKSISWPDMFIEQGTTQQLQDRYGFAIDELTERIVALIENKA